MDSFRRRIRRLAMTILSTVLSITVVLDAVPVPRLGRCRVIMVGMEEVIMAEEIRVVVMAEGDIVVVGAELAEGVEGEVVVEVAVAVEVVVAVEEEGVS
jgi:hypothetical protein